MKKGFKLIASLLALMMVSGCSCSVTPGPNPSDSQDESSQKTSSIEAHEIVVKYYVDFNAFEGNKRDVYHTQTVQLNDKLTKPANPTSTFPEFKTFVGWSTKPVIDEDKDLWNFDTDVVYTADDTLIMFGIWDA